MFHRRRFLDLSVASATAAILAHPTLASLANVEPIEGEGLVDWIVRQRGQWDDVLYRKMLGAANEFKEGDAIVGVAADDAEMRLLARRLLANTTLGQIDEHPPHRDELYRWTTGYIDPTIQAAWSERTIESLKTFLIERSESEIHAIRNGLSSDVISCVVRLMTNDELITVGAKVFNPLPGTNLGAKGYMGARIQPNSPTDHVDDICWQVFNAFAFAVGDVLIGTNPVSSDVESVAKIESALRDVLVTFGIADVMPHCVLAHIDVQAEVERKYPGTTAFWFQSIAGNDAANGTFDISLDKMIRHAASRIGKYGLYFETGQGADFTNEHSFGVDMVTLESRKYGFARSLTATIENSLRESGSSQKPWVHLNDVAGFIGPEVFRSKEQLVRCCLEDIVMGKLHGLMIGLDVCTTLHMDVTIDELGWCIDQIMPANPGYLMALPTRIDPMLGYLTTGFQDHVHVREKFGYKVNDAMWRFFQSLGVIDQDGKPTAHFGNPAWVYLQYCRKKSDTRTDAEILAEAAVRMGEVRARGLFIADGYGDKPSVLKPTLQSEIHRIYADAKDCIWKELDPAFVASIQNSVVIKTRSEDRSDYILHPTSGERLNDESLRTIQRIRSLHSDNFDTQIVISDGLNATAVMEHEQLPRLMTSLRTQLLSNGFRVSPQDIVVISGRVRAGYRIGEKLFSGRSGKMNLVHIIGERPGSGHHTLSIYLTRADSEVWDAEGTVDHNITRVVSGIAMTALLPEQGAEDAVRIMKGMA